MYETVSAKLGVCLPSTCSQEEIEAIARQCKYAIEWPLSLINDQ